jgi:hypothetical protein
MLYVYAGFISARLPLMVEVGCHLDFNHATKDSTFKFEFQIHGFEP